MATFLVKVATTSLIALLALMLIVVLTDDRQQEKWGWTAVGVLTLLTTLSGAVAGVLFVWGGK